MAEINKYDKEKFFKQRNASMIKEHERLTLKGIRPGIIHKKLAAKYGFQCEKSVDRIVKGRPNKKK